MLVTTMSDQRLGLTTTPNPRYLGLTTIPGPSDLGLTPMPDLSYLDPAIMFRSNMAAKTKRFRFGIQKRCMGLTWLPDPGAWVKKKFKNNSAKANLNLYFEILKIN